MITGAKQVSRRAVLGWLVGSAGASFGLLKYFSTPGPYKIHRLIPKTFVSEGLNFKGISVILVSSEWCPPCERQYKAFRFIASRFYDCDGIQFASLCTQDINMSGERMNPDTKAFFKVMGSQVNTPTTIIFKNGKEITRFIGYTSRFIIEHTILKLIK